MVDLARDSRTWVVVPAYNEASVLDDVLAALLQRFEHVVVVDDGSGDSTATVASARPVHVLRHPVNLGQGAALQTGLTYSLARGAERVATFDSDGQMDPADLVRAVERLSTSGADVCLGTRFGSGAVVGMPATRRFVLRLAVALSRLLFHARQTDVHNGLRVFSRGAAERLTIRADGMAHATDIVMQIDRLGLRWVETPVTIRYTAYSMRKGQRTLNAFNILWELFFG